jgi:hypothetical protein
MADDKSKRAVPPEVSSYLRRPLCTLKQPRDDADFSRHQPVAASLPVASERRDGLETKARLIRGRTPADSSTGSS